jgi:hypothetical protein
MPGSFESRVPETHTVGLSVRWQSELKSRTHVAGPLFCFS